MIINNILVPPQHRGKPGTAPSQHPTGASPLTTKGKPQRGIIMIINDLRSLLITMHANSHCEFGFFLNFKVVIHCK